MYNNLRTKILVPGNDNIGIGLKTAGYLRQPIPRNGLVGEWLLNGNANDSSGYGNNGTATNVTWTDTDKGYQKQCGGFTTDGSNITCAASTYGITGDFSAVAWIKTGTLSDNENMIFHKDGSSGFRDFQFRVNKSDGTLTLFRGDTGGGAYCDFKTTGYSVYDGVYHLIVATFSTVSGSIIYIDGISRATDGTTTGKAFSTQTLYLGGRSDSLADFNGNIQLARLYNRVLSPMEIQNLYQEGLALLH